MRKTRSESVKHDVSSLALKLKFAPNYGVYVNEGLETESSSR